MQKGIVLQDVFLNQLRKENVQVTVHLINGFQIKGVIKGFDSFIILLETEGKQMVLYKHAISTLTPARNILVSFSPRPESEQE